MRIRLSKQIHSCFADVSSADVFVHKVVDMEFMPFVGMYITDVDFEEKIEQITYDINTREITAYLEEEKTFYEKGLHEGGFIDYHNDPKFLEIVESYLNQNWIE